MTIPWTTVVRYGESIYPEDAEERDIERIKGVVDNYFDYAYPKFTPEIITALDKEYFLPALKVLNRTKDGRFYSPSHEVEWKNMELVAECRALSFNPPQIKYRKSLNGGMDAFISAGDFIPAHNKHHAPDFNCDCGIYGSVNLEEISSYIKPKDIDYAKLLASWSNEHLEEESMRSLCIIEPFPDAKVILCRKGWRAEKVFISEIVEETISISDASNLLSIAWHREIDIRRVYENR